MMSSRFFKFAVFLYFCAYCQNSFALTDNKSVLSDLAKSIEGRWLSTAYETTCTKKYITIKFEYNYSRMIVQDFEGGDYYEPYGYDVLGVIEGNRIRMIMDGETRTMPSGKLIVWHLVKKDDDTFYWMTDESGDEKTPESLRCN